MVPYPFSSQSKVDLEYRPEDFRDEIASYRDMTGNPCEYVPSGYLHPDYSVLKGKRLEYYLWWRTAVERGIPAETDEGYVWLRCTELIVSDRDPHDVLRALVSIIDSLDRWNYPLLKGLLSLTRGYVLVNGLYSEDLPAFANHSIRFHSFDHDVTWSLTRYPIRSPSTRRWWDIGIYDWSSAGISGDEMESILMKSLEGIDERCRSSKGMGFLRATVNGWRTEIVDPYRGFMMLGAQECVRIPEVDVSEGLIHDMINSIVKQVTALIRTDGKKGPAVPKTFPKEYRKIVAAAIDAVLYDDPWDPRSFRTDGEGFWEDDDLEVETPFDGGRCLIRNLSMDCGDPIVFRKEDLDSHWNDESEVPVGYVPSNRRMPVPEAMSPEQLAFHVYWRTMARRGVFLDSDRGYAWLFCTELINHDEDPVAVQSLLDRALRACGSERSYADDIARAACDHALLHGMDPPHLYWDVLPAASYLKMVSEPIGRITSDVGCYLADWDFTDYVGADRDLYEDCLTAAYRAVDDHRCSTVNTRLAGLFGKGRLSSMRRRLYPGLWTPKDTTITLKYRINVPPELESIAEGIARTVLRTVNRRMGGTIPRSSEGFPEEYERIAEAAAIRVMDDREARRRKKDAVRQVSEIVIDRDAVVSATEDLAAVTDMMAVEEEEDHREETAVEQAPTGWDAFLASLDDVERMYLRDGRAALKGTGRRQSAVEASVNEKAMDAVGDIVMNDGVVLPEYAEDVRRLLE